MVLGAEGSVAKWPQGWDGRALGSRLPGRAEKRNPRQQERRSRGLEFERASGCARSWARAWVPTRDWAEGYPLPCTAARLFSFMSSVS